MRVHQARGRWTVYGVDTRAYNCIRNEIGARFAGRYSDEAIFRPDVICMFSEQELLLLPNMGKKSVASVKAWLAEHGRTLKGESKPSAFPCDLEFGY